MGTNQYNINLLKPDNPNIVAIHSLFTQHHPKDHWSKHYSMQANRNELSLSILQLPTLALHVIDGGSSRAEQTSRI